MSRGALINVPTAAALKEVNANGLGYSRDHVAQAYMGQWGCEATVAKVRQRVHWITSQVLGPRVLDIGTSEGIVPILLGREGFHVVGIDVNADAVEYANALLDQEPEAVRQRVEFRNISLFQCDLDLSFDTVILSEVIEHVSNVDRFLDGAMTHLRPHGTMIATTPFGVHPDRHHRHTFFLSDIQRLFAERGAIEHLSVEDGYIRLILRNFKAEELEGEQPRLPDTDLLALTEEATLQAQIVLWQQLDTVGKRLEELKRQAEDAQSRTSAAEQDRQELHAALRDARQEAWRIQERLRAAEQSLVERQAEIADLRSSMHGRSEEQRMTLAENTELRASHDALQQEVRYQEVHLARMQEQHKFIKEKLAEREVAHKRVVAAREQDQSALTAVNKELASLKETVVAKDKRIAELASTCAARQEALQKIAEELDHAGRSRQQAERQTEDARQHLAKTEAKLSEAQRRVEALEIEVTKAQDLLEEQQKILNRQTAEHEVSQQRVAHLESRVSEMSQTLKNSRTAHHKATEQLAAKSIALDEAKAQLDRQEKVLISTQCDGHKLKADITHLQRQLEVTRQESRTYCKELSQLKVTDQQKLVVVDGTQLRWVEPLTELFSHLQSDSRKLAKLCTEIAKERYRSNSFSMLLLASLADAVDPQPARRKWLGFRMLKAGLLDAAEELLTPLVGSVSFSPSEEKAWHALVNRPKQTDAPCADTEIGSIKVESTGADYGTLHVADHPSSSPVPVDVSTASLQWNLDCADQAELDIFFNIEYRDSENAPTADTELAVQFSFLQEECSCETGPTTLREIISFKGHIPLAASQTGIIRVSFAIPTGTTQLRATVPTHKDIPGLHINTAIKAQGFREGISVVIPSFDGQRTIVECLQSLADQTLHHSQFEIIVVLNGPIGNSRKLLDGFHQSHPKINLVVLESETPGAGLARNLGIDAAKFKYITYVDDDDFVSAGYLKGLLQYASSNTISVANIVDVVEGEIVDSAINSQIQQAPGAEVDFNRIPSAVTLNACKLVETRHAKETRYKPHLQSGEDVEYWCRLISKYKPKFFTVKDADNAVYFRRVRANSISRQPRSFDFKVRQRLEVVLELETIKADIPLQSFVNSKVNAQLLFAVRYLREHPGEWVQFRDLATTLGVSARAISYVNARLASQLIISYCFPPFIDTAGIVMAKRIIEAARPADVISNTMKGVRNRDHKLWQIVEPSIGNFHEVQSPPSFADWKAIEHFTDATLRHVRSRIDQYRELYSRSMWPGSHFAAALLKLRYPQLKWDAEFSDPLLIDVKGKHRDATLNVQWLEENGFLKRISERGFLPLETDRLFFWCEMLPYIFSDRLIFTNESQKQYMLETISDPDVRAQALLKSTVMPHPTLPSMYYRKAPTEYAIDPDKKHVAYFGSFYATRGLGILIKAFLALPTDVQKKLNIHVFSPQKEAVDGEWGSKEGVFVNDVVGYCEFLNLSTRMDVLLVNDAATAGLKSRNPYLPSKLSDYLGSGSDIWALYEEGSELHKAYQQGLIRYGSPISSEEHILKILTQISG